jgi:membrane protease subunit (stomatin/prohibitin family)
MSAIQRPSEAETALFWRAPRAALPIGTPLLVDEKDCVVSTLDGAVLGVIPPGSHSLDPRSFPFLARCIDPSSCVTAELWFVRTTDYRGVKFGGPVGAVYDATAEVQVTPRVMGEYAVKVVDASRFVQGSMAMTDVHAVLAWVSGIVMRKTKESVGRILQESKSVVDVKLLPRLTDELTKPLPELESLGVALRMVSNLAINFSEDDTKALKAGLAAKAAAQRARKIAEMEENARGGGAAGAEVAAPVVASPPGGAPVGVAGTGVTPARKPKGMLWVGLGLAGVVVIGLIIAIGMHYMNGGSSEKPHPAAGHDAKHGKH